MTATGTLVGNATYLAPERCSGRPATQASDVYSLAVVLYQMLAGIPPFTSSDPVQLVSAHAHDPVPPLPSDVPAVLAQCCMRALEKDPALRPASALAFGAMLRECTRRGRHALGTDTGGKPEPGLPSHSEPLRGSVASGGLAPGNSAAAAEHLGPADAFGPANGSAPPRWAVPAQGPGSHAPAPLLHTPGAPLQTPAPPLQTPAPPLQTPAPPLQTPAPPLQTPGPHAQAPRHAPPLTGPGPPDPAPALSVHRSGAPDGSGAAHGYAGGSWPATQVLPTTEPWPAHPQGRRRWWLAAAAVITAVAAVAAITVAFTGTSASRHAAKRTEAIAVHTNRGSPTAAPPSLPPSSLPATAWEIAVGTQQNPGQAQPPPPVLAPAGTTVRLAETLLNGTQQRVTSAALSLSAPQGWTVTPESPPAVGSVPAGGKATVTWRISIPAATQPGGFNLVGTATCAAAASCTAAPVNGSAVVPYASFSQAFNNLGIAPQADGAAANLDGTGQSYQAEALAAAGYLPGGQVTHDGISFAWPDSSPGAPDNVAAQGQTFLISATGAHLAFLGASDFGGTGGDGVIFYQNGTQQAFHLVMDDWWSNQATAGQDEIAVTTPQANGPPGQPPLTGPPVAVFFAAIPLQQGSAVAAVTLPAGSAPAIGVPCLHLFAVALG